MGKIQVGYGSDTRSRGPKNAYGGRTGGKKITNGGFNGLPVVSYERIEQEDWDRIFPPKIKREDTETI